MKIRKIIFLTTALVIAFNAAAMASGWSQNIAVEFNSVNLNVNGKAVNADNILYNGTTYVPLRATAEMLGCEVGWEESTSTAKITQYDDNEQIAYIFHILYDVNQFNRWLRSIDTLADFTFTKAHWNRKFHKSDDTYYQGLTDYFNYASEHYKNITDYKDKTYSILADKTSKENLDNLYSSLGDAYGKLCYVYSLVKNLMESSGYICTEQEFVDNMRQLFQFCENIETHYDKVYNDYLVYLYK